LSVGVHQSSNSTIFLESGAAQIMCNRKVVQLS